MKRCSSSSTSKVPSKRNKHHHHDDREDRISELPEPILHSILSLIPAKDAAKTSVLSKSLNSVWNSFPVSLDFDQYSFKKSVQEFCKYVNDSIKGRRADACIQGFKLTVCFNNTGLKSRWEDLERWINYAVSNEVQNLVLRYYNNTKSKKAWPYPLPTSSAIFRAKSLKELELFGCKFGEPRIQFPFSLKKLTLEHVDIDDRTLQGLLSNCGSLEELTIKHCSGFESVNLSSDKLKTVNLFLNRCQVQKVVAIDAPNLRSLSYGGDCANVMRSLEASNINKNLTELKFHSGITITDAVLTRVTRGFRFLKKIEFDWCYLQGNIRLSDLGTGNRKILLKNDELIADCRNCFHERSPRDIPPGLYKLEV